MQISSVQAQPQAMSPWVQLVAPECLLIRYEITSKNEAAQVCSPYCFSSTKVPTHLKQTTLCWPPPPIHLSLATVIYANPLLDNKSLHPPRVRYIKYVFLAILTAGLVVTVRYIDLIAQKCVGSPSGSVTLAASGGYGGYTFSVCVTYITIQSLSYKLCLCSLPEVLTLPKWYMTACSPQLTHFMLWI